MGTGCCVRFRSTPKILFVGLLRIVEFKNTSTGTTTPSYKRVLYFHFIIDKKNFISYQNKNELLTYNFQKWKLTFWVSDERARFRAQPYWPKKIYFYWTHSVIKVYFNENFLPQEYPGWQLDWTQDIGAWHELSPQHAEPVHTPVEIH